MYLCFIKTTTMNAKSTGNHMADMPYLPNDNFEGEEFYCDGCGCRFKSDDPKVIAMSFADQNKAEFIYCHDCDIDGDLSLMRKEDISHQGYSRMIITNMSNCKK